MSKTTFYRKYRSRTFSELIGQEHIVQTLSNAITHDRLGHAYIFSGPRGTGKTSTARIFAKSLNCANGPTTEPCLTCDNCKKITSGQSVDVLEIDAASHTGVDHMRDLNDQVQFMPVECRYKVYIIDEVHMLSTGAFNALLKTLEEPPQNVIFILATTESHKIPATIHSRCQQLHFRLLKTSEIVGHLEDVATKESITVDSASLHMIARQASGCMRDALSLFNQIYSFKGAEIQLADVQLILGATDSSQIVAFLEPFFQAKEAEALEHLKQILDSGAHVIQIAAQLTEHIQYCIYAKHQILGDADLDDARRESFAALAQHLSLEKLVALLEAFASLESSMRYFPNPAMLLQVKVCVFMQTIVSGRMSSAPVEGAPSSSSGGLRQAQPAQAQTQRVAAPVASPQAQSAPVAVASSTPTATPTIKAEPKVVQAVAPPRVNSNDPWQTVLAVMERDKKALYAILNGSRAVDPTSSPVKVLIAEDYRFPFFLEKLKEDKNKSWLQEQWQQISGSSASLEFTFSDAPSQTGNGAGSSDARNGVAKVPDQARNNSSEGGSEQSQASVTQANAAKTINQIVSMFQGKVIS